MKDEASTICPTCNGSGYSQEANALKNTWFNNTNFKPEHKNSEPFLPDNTHVLDIAKRHVYRSPEFFGTDKEAINREAIRLCGVWNASWSHHLSDADVSALYDAGRLRSFKHKPSAKEVNTWSLSGIGHDSINCHICVVSECKRNGVNHLCIDCDE